MDYIAYFKKLGISIKDEKKFLNWIEYKGFERYKIIANIALEHFDYITCDNLYDIYRYDIRLRRVLVQYISYFEVFCRATITNKYNCVIQEESLEEDVKECIYIINNDVSFDELDNVLSGVRYVMRKYKPKNDLFSILENSSIKLVLDILDCYSKEELLSIFDIVNDYEHLTMNLRAIRVMRNYVSHNRLILDPELTFPTCFVEDQKLDTLKHNMMNISQHLPTVLKKSFNRKINECRRGLYLPKSIYMKL